jgi:hypothetical protein
VRSFQPESAIVRKNLRNALMRINDLESSCGGLKINKHCYNVPAHERNRQSWIADRGCVASVAPHL